MRQIEKKMIAAVNGGYNFMLDNTSVEHRGGVCRVYLHGYCIYTKSAEGAEFGLCGWNTNTTRSRLRALGVGVTCKDFSPMYNGMRIDAYKRYSVE